jgi:uncharacterized membrane protein YjjB (DUF3815 family)
METNLLQLITAALGSLGFSLVFNVRGKPLLWGAVGGLLAWGSYLFFKAQGTSDVVGYLLASMLITVYSEVCARWFRAPATVFLMSSAIPLIPGGSLYRTMVCAVKMQGMEFLRVGTHTMLLAAAISAGIILVSTVLHAYYAARGRGPGQS